MKNKVKEKLSKHKMIQMINSTKNILPTVLKSVEPQATVSSTSNPDEASTSAINVPLSSEVQSSLSGVSSTTFKSKSYETLVSEIDFAFYSLSSAANKGELFRLMFKGHQSAEEFGMSPAKLSYVINFGLAPYFKSTFMNDLIPLKGSSRLPPKFVSCFDESLSKVVYSKQMDLHIIYFDEINKQVKRVYIGSQFMGLATVECMIKDFKEAHNGLDYVMNLIQFSMYGPNTNWVFHRAVSDLRKSENPCGPDLVEIESCGLHVVHGAFGTDVEKTDWKMGKKLNAAWSIFKKSSARRSDYLSVNNIACRNDYNSVKGIFPLKYVGHRWLENGKVIDRLLLVGNKLLVFLRQYNEEKKFPRDDDRFSLLLELFSSYTGNAQYEFCLVVIRDIEPFLTLFQSEKALAPFLFEKLKGLIVLILQRFVKLSVIREASTNAFKLINLKLEGKNLLPLHEIDDGSGCEVCTEEVKDSWQARGEEISRSPLKCKLTKGISSLSPTQICSLKPEFMKKRFSSPVEHLMNATICLLLMGTKP